MTPKQLYDLRHILTELDEFTATELASIMNIPATEIQPELATMATEGLLTLPQAYRYKLVNIGAKIHLMELNIAYLSQIEREKRAK